MKPATPETLAGLRPLLDQLCRREPIPEYVAVPAIPRTAPTPVLAPLCLAGWEMFAEDFGEPPPVDQAPTSSA